MNLTLLWLRIAKERSKMHKILQKFTKIHINHAKNEKKPRSFASIRSFPEKTNPICRPAAGNPKQEDDYVKQTQFDRQDTGFNAL